MYSLEFNKQEVLNTDTLEQAIDAMEDSIEQGNKYNEHDPGDIYRIIHNGQIEECYTVGRS